jgi:CubicO group peptidase (beta-lactamase class C family)
MTWWQVLQAAAGLLVLSGAGYFVWCLVSLILENRAYAQLTDTKDLKTQLADWAQAYVKKKKLVRLTVGLVQHGKTHVVTFGDDAPPAADTPPGRVIYEIGSVTKAFTGLALAHLEKAGHASLDDPITKWLPAVLTLPEDAQAITLKQLATHTAGMPRLPGNFFAYQKDPANPYKEYSEAALFEALAKVKLNGAPGAKSAYSNFGMGLLGHVLARRQGTDFEGLLRQAVTGPLLMPDTCVVLDPMQMPRFLVGKKSEGQPGPRWEFDALAGAGALHATADDLLNFVRANLAAPAGPLGAILARAQEVHYKENDMVAHGLGWVIYHDSGKKLTYHWHNGGTGSYVSFVGFDKEHQVGVVLLSNHGDAFLGDTSVDRMAIKLLITATKVSWE